MIIGSLIRSFWVLPVRWKLGFSLIMESFANIYKIARRAFKSQILYDAYVVADSGAVYSAMIRIGSVVIIVKPAMFFRLDLNYVF